MTDKELQEWEEEAKEAEQDIKKMYKTLFIIIIIGGILYAISNTF